MSFSNIIIANIGWADTYEGEAITSAMSYVVEHGTGAEAYNFSVAPDGLFYGYLRNGDGLAKRSDRLWTVVFISKPKDSEPLRVVGWYEDATVGGYRTRPEYGYDPHFPEVRPGERFIFSTAAAKAFVAHTNDRSTLVLPRGHRIGSSGIYFAAGENNPADSSEQRRARSAMAEWLRKVLPPLREASRLSHKEMVVPLYLPGIHIDDGGTPAGYSAVAESDEHRTLRLWARDNAKQFTGKMGPSGETEWRLPSGDRVDAMHETVDGLWLIEAKSRRSGEDDMERGVYQCIKYRAVAEAVRTDSPHAPPVHAVLLTENDLSHHVRDLADRHDIRHVRHRC